MIRNLKALLGLAAVLSLFAAFSAPGAQAVEFHCSVEPCKLTARADGTGKTAHHVFIIKKGVASGNMTCNGITAEGVSGVKTFAEFTLINVNYGAPGSCNFASGAGTVAMNGCDYLFNIATAMKIKCPENAEIEMSGGGCLVKIPPQTPAGGGGTYTNLGGKTEITLTLALTGISGNAGAGCGPILGFVGAFTEGEYTTGNTIVTGETEPGVMASFWWE